MLQILNQIYPSQKLQNNSKFKTENKDAQPAELSECFFLDHPTLPGIPYPTWDTLPYMW